MNGLVVGVREAFSQAVKEQLLAQFGKLHRLGKPLGGRHFAERIKIRPPIRFRFGIHSRMITGSQQGTLLRAAFPAAAPNSVPYESADFSADILHPRR